MRNDSQNSTALLVIVEMRLSLNVALIVMVDGRTKEPSQ